VNSPSHFLVTLFISQMWQVYLLVTILELLSIKIQAHCQRKKAIYFFPGNLCILTWKLFLFLIILMSPNWKLRKELERHLEFLINIFPRFSHCRIKSRAGRIVYFASTLSVYTGLFSAILESFGKPWCVNQLSL
jgi:hypothetical protein